MIEISQEAETIGGFYVDKKMKAVWIAELELLKKFIFVCEKYNLTYYFTSSNFKLFFDASTIFLCSNPARSLSAAINIIITA